MKTYLKILVIVLIPLSHGSRAYGQDLGNLKNQKPFSIHGSIGLNLMAYTVGGIPARQEPFSFVLSANATASIYGIELPFSISISDKQKSYSQPFNQFGLSPHWKWITVHAGYRNVTFSNFTLAGYTFLGAGIELTPSIFRFGFVYGRFDRKTTTNPNNPSDSLPAFTRKGYAVKLGVGSQKNFFDLLMLRIRDDSNSVKQIDTSAIRTPEQNVVLGFNSKFTLAKNLTWENEGAVSLITTNLGANEISDAEENNFLRSVNKFLVINQSSEYSTALRSAMNFRSKPFNFKLEYRRIDPKYSSMGAYFFNTDVENLTFSPSFGLFKNIVNVSGSIGVQRDNLKKTKKATSQRLLGAINLSVNPSSKFGIDLGYNTYALGQKAGRMPLSDSTRIRQNNQTFTVTPRLMFVNSEKSNMVMINYSYFTFTDKNEFTSPFTEFNMHTAVANYMLGLMQKKWSFTFGVNFNRLAIASGNTTGYGLSASASKILLKDKMNVNWNNSLSRTESPAVKAWIFTSGLLTSYQVAKHHSLRLNLYYTGNYGDAGNTNPTYNEFKGDLSYVYTF